MYAIRQTIVKHIITVSPDVSQLFHDEEGYKKSHLHWLWLCRWLDKELSSIISCCILDFVPSWYSP